MLNFRRLARVVLGLWLLYLGTVCPVWAQSDRGAITGTVVDSSGAVVVGVTVTATSSATGVSTKAVTGSNGNYTVPLLPGYTKSRLNNLDSRSMFGSKLRFPLEKRFARISCLRWVK
jgi:hypothetical protein